MSHNEKAKHILTIKYVQGLTLMGPLELQLPPPLPSPLPSPSFYFSEFQNTYLQGGNRDADTEKEPVGTVGEGEGGMNWESSADIYKLPCVKQTASGKLLLTQGSQLGALWWPRRSWPSGMGDVGWEAQEEGDICIQKASLLCFTPETNTELYSNNTWIKKK